MRTKDRITIQTEFGTFTRTTARKYSHFIITTGRMLEARRADLLKDKETSLRYAAKYQRIVDAIIAAKAKFCNEICGNSIREAQQIRAGIYTKGQLVFADVQPDSYEGVGYHSLETWQKFVASSLESAANADEHLTKLVAYTKYESVQWSSRLDLARKYAAKHVGYGYENVHIIEIATGKAVL